MIFSETFLKLFLVVTWLNIFVLLEPFVNKDGYRQIIFGKNATFITRAGFFLAMNAAFILWAMVLAARV